MEPAHIILRSPSDILAVLPYQLGYHPRDSAVAIALHARRVGMLARADRPPPGHEGVVVATVLPPLLREPPDAVILVGYENEPGEVGAVLDALAEGLAEAGTRVADRLVVRDGRWSRPVCPDGCCPAEEGPLPDASQVPGVAAFVEAERAPLSGRDELPGLVAADLAAGLGVARAVRVVRGRQGSGRASRRPVRAWGRILDTAGPPTGPSSVPPGEVAAVACSLTDHAWRDALIAWVAPGSLPLGELDAGMVRALRRGVPRPSDPLAQTRVQARLLELCRRMPDETPAETAEVCAVTACVLWSAGQGALAREAVDRALRVVPGHRLGGLIEQMLDLGVRPRTVGGDPPCDGGTPRDGDAVADGAAGSRGRGRAAG
jgi:hypothetical protein